MARRTVDENIQSVIRAFDACGKHVRRARINGRGITIETDEGDTVQIAPPPSDEDSVGAEEIIL